MVPYVVPADRAPDMVREPFVYGGYGKDVPAMVEPHHRVAKVEWLLGYRAYRVDGVLNILE